MTSEGSTHGRFARAVQRRNVRAAELAARELQPLALRDALELVVLYASVGSPKFEPAAVRFLVRLGGEGREVTLGRLQLAASALVALRGRDHDAALKTLLRLL